MGESIVSVPGPGMSMLSPGRLLLDAIERGQMRLHSRPEDLEAARQVGSDLMGMRGPRCRAVGAKLILAVRKADIELAREAQQADLLSRGQATLIVGAASVDLMQAGMRSLDEFSAAWERRQREQQALPAPTAGAGGDGRNAADAGSK